MMETEVKEKSLYEEFSEKYKELLRYAIWIDGKVTTLSRIIEELPLALDPALQKNSKQYSGLDGDEFSIRAQGTIDWVRDHYRQTLIEIEKLANDYVLNAKKQLLRWFVEELKAFDVTKQTPIIVAVYTATDTIWTRVIPIGKATHHPPKRIYSVAYHSFLSKISIETLSEILIDHTSLDDFFEIMEDGIGIEVPGSDVSKEEKREIICSMKERYSIHTLVDLCQGEELPFTPGEVFEYYLESSDAAPRRIEYLGKNYFFLKTEVHEDVITIFKGVIQITSGKKKKISELDPLFFSEAQIKAEGLKIPEWGISWPEKTVCSYGH